MLRETLRPDDLAYRSGGDEFAAILPHAGRIEGEAHYARVQATLLRRSDSPAPAVSLSAGIAEPKRTTTEFRSSSARNGRCSGPSRPERDRRLEVQKTRS